jgi:predicted TPR repeat methyltransferase
LADPLACDDPIATSRHAYALAAARDGDWLAAAEVLEQTLERAPRWASAWFALGEAREKLGAEAGAAEAYRAALEFDPEDAHGAGARLALIGRGEATALPPAYLERLFDEYAARFEAHLIGELGYRGPELVLAELDRVAPGRRFARALDLGCGTGLAGAALRPRVDHLVGVDLSARMIARSRTRGIYDSLAVAEAVAFLAAAPPGRADLIVAADVLVYLGDLTPVFAAAARALAPEGWIVFSLEASEGEGFRLGAGMRFAHAKSHVEAAAARAGFRALALAPAWARREAGREVAGWIGCASVA